MSQFATEKELQDLCNEETFERLSKRVKVEKPEGWDMWKYVEIFEHDIEVCIQDGKWDWCDNESRILENRYGDISDLSVAERIVVANNMVLWEDYP